MLTAPRLSQSGGFLWLFVRLPIKKADIAQWCIGECRQADVHC
jgi:hypothetical protein